MKISLRLFIGSLALLLSSLPITAAAACLGDCDRSGEVSVDEVVRGVNIALGSAQLSICPVFDGDGDGSVTINEIVGAVNAALSGCPANPPTPTATATATPSPSGPAISGIAATGAPIVGTVCAVDGKGTQLPCVTIAADGSFRVPTTGSEAPYLLAAIPNGSGQKQFSWSNATSGVVNINPFTTLSLLLATNKGNLNNLFADWKNAKSSVKADTLADALDAVLMNFSAQLAGKVPSGFNPFQTAFFANGTGFDGVLDNLRFVFDFAAGTIKLNGQNLVINFDPGLPGGNYRLTLSVSVSNGPSMQVAVLNNIPKPASTSEFCSPAVYNNFLSTLGSFSITSCTFDGSVGRLAVKVSVSGFNLSYAVTYTYTPL